MKCNKHPKYKGRTKPRNECEGCLKLYSQLQKPRVLPKPSKVIRSKKVYSRKKVKNDCRNSFRDR